MSIPERIATFHGLPRVHLELRALLSLLLFHLLLGLFPQQPLQYLS